MKVDYCVVIETLLRIAVICVRLISLDVVTESQGYHFFIFSLSQGFTKKKKGVLKKKSLHVKPTSGSDNSPHLLQVETLSPKQLPIKHLLQVCHDIRNNGPQCRAEVHVLRVLNGHGVTFTVMEPEVATVGHMEAGSWTTGGRH